MMQGLALHQRLDHSPSTSAHVHHRPLPRAGPVVAPVRRRACRASSSRFHQTVQCYAVPAAVTEKPVTATPPKPLPRAVENAADDPSLHNPLQRMERLSTGWFGVIAEYEGVVVEDTLDAHARAWLQVADELGYQRPLGQVLRRIKGARDEVVSA